MATTTEAGRAAAARDELITSLRAVVADAEQLLEATADETGSKIKKLRERAQENLDAARARLTDTNLDLEASARRMAGATDEYVHTNPWESIGFAAAAGLVLGVLLTRR